MPSLLINPPFTTTFNPQKVYLAYSNKYIATMYQLSNEKHTFF